MDGQAPRPYLAPPSLIASGSATVSDSVTETEILEIPADTTFVGWVTVVPVNRATSASPSFQTARVRIDGATATPANDSDILIAGGASLGATTAATQYLQVTAGSSAVSLMLVNSTATTFDSCASANGVFVTKPTIS